MLICNRRRVYTRGTTSFHLLLTKQTSSGQAPVSCTNPIRYNRRNLSQPYLISDSVRCSEAIFHPPCLAPLSTGAFSVKLWGQMYSLRHCVYLFY